MKEKYKFTATFYSVDINIDASAVLLVLQYVCVYLVAVYKRLCFMSFNTRSRLKVLIVVLSAVVGVKGDQVV